VQDAAAIAGAGLDGSVARSAPLVRVGELGQAEIARTRGVSPPLLIIWHRLNAHRAREVMHYIAAHARDYAVAYLPAYAPRAQSRGAGERVGQVVHGQRAPRVAQRALHARPGQLPPAPRSAPAHSPLLRSCRATMLSDKREPHYCTGARSRCSFEMMRERPSSTVAWAHVRLVEMVALLSWTGGVTGATQAEAPVSRVDPTSCFPINWYYRSTATLGARPCDERAAP